MNIKDIAFAESPSWDSSIHETFRWMRENEPVYWSEKDQLWVVTRYEDVVAISKDQALFTSGEGVRPGPPMKLGLIDEHEPRHGQLRKLLNKGFTPRMVNKLEEVFRKLVDEQLDGIAEKGECDFVTSVSAPLPLLVIAEMMGIRREDRDSLHRWSDDMMRGEGNQNNPEIMAASAQAFMDYSAYVTDIIEDRRENPQDDLITILVGAERDGALVKFDAEGIPGHEADEEHMDLHNSELILLLVVLMAAGNETTRNAMSGGLQCLIDNPAQRQRLIDDPSLMNSAVEEMLRWVSPVVSFTRTVTEDTVYNGHEMKKDQKVLMIYPSANHDERKYQDADVFKVERDPEHVAFGVGTHFCLGANLARMEMRVTFSELLRRFPDMEYADGGPVLRPHALVRSCTELKVRFTPETAPRESDAALG
jgi:cytochrome P450 family 142 subfamily A polypeptide 1